MRRNNTKFKSSARENLLGHYGAVIAALIVTVLISLLLSIPFTNMASQGYQFGSVYRMVVGIMGIVIVMLLSFLFFIGTLWIHLNLARKQEAHFSDILYPFTNQPARYFGYGLMFLGMAVVCILPGFICIMLSADYSSELRTVDIKNIPLLIIGIALFIIGLYICIRIMGSWFMAAYLMVDDTDLRLMDAIRESRQMMKGKRKTWILLILSFAGWIALSLLSFGIALIWVVPYLTQSLTCFYLDLLPDSGCYAGYDDF